MFKTDGCVDEISQNDSGAVSGSPLRNKVAACIEQCLCK